MADTKPVLVAVMPGQPIAVVQAATNLAVQSGSPLICAFVEVSAYAVGPGQDKDKDSGGTARSIDPDGVADFSDTSRLRANLARELDDGGADWSFQLLAGNPAKALASAAAAVAAWVIVVGTRERGIGHRLEDLLAGSVAVHLTHSQPLPVLVVPLGHAGAGGKL
jgi:nucleotide-binding universal stress UspA family protein